MQSTNVWRCASWRCCKYQHKRRSQGNATFTRLICTLAHFIQARQGGPKNLVFPSFARATNPGPRAKQQACWRQHAERNLEQQQRRRYLPRGANNLTYGPDRRGPRAPIRDRTADTIAAVHRPVGTTPTGVESAGGPPRTAAVAPHPHSHPFVRRFFWWS